MSRIAVKLEIMVTIPLFFLFLTASSSAPTAAAAGDSFRGHFDRLSNTRPSRRPMETFGLQFSVYDCTALCATSDTCRSVGYERPTRTCHVFDAGSADAEAQPLVAVEGYDLYDRIAMTYFTRISDHHLPIKNFLEIPASSSSSSSSSTSLEECAWRCLAESQFDCHGFNHQRSPSVCFLLNASPVEGSLPAIRSDTMDFYERTIDYDPMGNFLNFGSGMLFPVGGLFQYNRSMRGVSVEQCAQRCLDEVKFRCSSFDYLHDGDLNFCLLSDSSVMADAVALTNQTLSNCNHFERIDSHLRMFQPTLYSRSTVDKVKVTTNSTPEECARTCLDEREFVCRSFDYQAEGGGKCLFSSQATDSRRGEGSVRRESGTSGHHFDMKPIYECGDNLTLPGRGIFSPGWPLGFAPHEDCTWYITASSNQMITIDFFHLELGDGGRCSDDSGDRLLVSELDLDPSSSPSSSTSASAQGQTRCLPSKTKRFVSRTNRLVFRFVSDGQNEDAVGFRASYTADWTCNAVLKRSPGEFASSGHPLRSYPAGSACTWRLASSNPKHRIRLDFPYFRLREHPLGHCTDGADHVKVRDGGTVNSPLVGVYCGSIPPFFVISAGREMVVQFKSRPAVAVDGPRDDRTRGFRAIYSFEEELGLEKTTDEAGQWLLDHEGGGPGSDDLDRYGVRFRISMWIVVSALMVLSLLLVGLLVLLARHHKRQMMKYESSFQWPWMNEIVSVKLLRSFKRIRRQDNDTSSNNLILNSREPTPLQDVPRPSREDNCPETQPSTFSSKFSRSIPFCSSSSYSSHSKYTRLNDKNIYTGDSLGSPNFSK